jgi:SSS family solute:Na+ symporter
VIGILIALIWSYSARGGYIIARATAIFFGICLSTFLPAFIGGLIFKKMTKAAALASMITGFLASSFWLLLVKASEAGAIGLVQHITSGKNSIFADSPNWPVVDPVLIALPISVLTAVVVSIFTKKPDQAHIDNCFGI